MSRSNAWMRRQQALRAVADDRRVEPLLRRVLRGAAVSRAKLLQGALSSFAVEAQLHGVHVHVVGHDLSLDVLCVLSGLGCVSVIVGLIARVAKEPADLTANECKSALRAHVRTCALVPLWYPPPVL